jgi:hypothetical protein
MMVLGDASVPHLVEAEHTLPNAERMLDPDPYTRLTAVLLFLRLVDIVLELRALTGHIPGFGRDREKTSSKGPQLGESLADTRASEILLENRMDRFSASRKRCES